MKRQCLAGKRIGSLRPAGRSAQPPQVEPCAEGLQPRSGRLAVVANGRLVGQARDETAPGGKLGTGVSGGAQLTALRVQEVEPVGFTDDFMRAGDELGGWEPATGRWKVQALGSTKLDADRGVNSFSLRADAEPRALAVAGGWFWDSYVYRAAVRPAGPGAVGLMAFYQDAGNYVIFRWRSDDTPRSVGARQIVWVENGKEHPQQPCGAGYQPGQWYELMLRATDTQLEAFIDGKPVAALASPPFCSGKIGLYAERCQASLDDVLCRHWEGPADDPSTGMDVAPIRPQFALDDTMSGWANPESDWRLGEGGWRWNRGDFWGDASLSIEMPSPQRQGGEAVLVIHATDGRPEGGYTLSLTPARDGSCLNCALRRQGRDLQQRRVAVGAWPALARLRRHKGALLVEVDGRRVVSVPDSEPLAGTRSALKTPGWTIPATALQAAGTRVTDDTFATAPVRWWQGQGRWEVTSRWSCQPGWTWITGTDSLTPVLWSKQAFGGDFTVEASVANRMDLPDFPGYSHPGDLNVTVCGDGDSLNSGYSFIFAGWNNTRSALLRRNECVARNEQAVLTDTTSKSAFHRHWFRIRVERRGNRLRHWVDDRLINEYVDAHPIPSGRVALWTYNPRPSPGGLVVARVRIWYQSEARATEFCTPGGARARAVHYEQW